jgi:serine/threonine protein kinase/HEAT repeat protein
MIVITCPKCRAQLEISSQQAGQVVKCSGCGAGLKIPMSRKESVTKEKQISAGAPSVPARPSRSADPVPDAPSAERSPPVQRNTITYDETPTAAREGQEVPVPERFGRYQILKKLGQGGMSTVYLAHDAQLDRRVALKIPQLSGENFQLQVDRFYREARAAATLNHPNLCPVFDVGEIDGVAYLTMAYVEGKLLTNYVNASPALNQRQIATLLRKIALAVHEAHKKSIIHRDLKPSNIMVNPRGEPVVMDFGLARRFTGDARLTQTGVVPGTPAYMSPEQIRGDTDAMGPRSDIYSLGVIFYELLTGRLPFRGDRMAMLAQILADEPPPPAQFRPDLDPALQAICLKAMAKDPGQRYPSMDAMATALADYLRGPRTTPMPLPERKSAERTPGQGVAPMSASRTQPIPARESPPPEPKPSKKSSSASRSTRKPAAAAATSPWMIIGIVGGSLAFLAIVATVVGIIAFRSSKTDDERSPSYVQPSGFSAKSPGMAVAAAPAKQDETKPGTKNEDAKKEKEDDDIVEAGPVSSNDVYKHALKSVAWILNAQAGGLSMGTGTLIDQKNRLVLTNYHVVYGQGQQRFRIYFPVYREKNGDLVVESNKFLKLAYNDQPNWGRVVDKDVARDLALIKIDFIPKDIQAIAVAKVWVTPGETVYSIGNSQAAAGGGGSLWGYFDGKVRQVGHKTLPIRGRDMAFDINARMIETTSPSNPGDSGGPLLNERGELVGVTESFLAGARNVSLFVDGREAVQFIESHFKNQGQQWDRATASLGGASADVGELVKRLDSADRKIRSRAIRTLGRIGPPARLAIPSLLALLRDPNNIVRQEVTDALEKIGPPERKDVHTLQQSLQDPSPEVRAYAAGALGKIGQEGRGYVGSLVAVLKGDKEPSVRQSAAKALGVMGAFAKESAGPALIGALADSDKDVRLAAAESLGGMEVAASDVPDLVKALKHQDMEVRKFAAQALGNLGPQARGVVPDLIEASKTGDTQVSGAAIVALGQVGADAKTAVPTIIEALNKKETRDLAIVALGKIGPDAKAAVPELTKNLKTKEAQGLVIEALGKIGTQAKSAVPDLADLLKDSDKELKPAIITALGRMGKDAKAAVPAIGSCLSPDDRETSIQALGLLAELGPDAKDAVGDIIALFVDENLRPDNKLRSEAVHTLARIGKPAVPKLIQSLGNPNRYMKAGVIEALGDIGPAAKDALPTIRRLANNPDPIISRPAARAAAKIGTN